MTDLLPDDLLAQGTCAVLIDGEVIGTAWLVSDEGHLLTAGHILGTDEPLDEVMVRFPEDIPRKAHKIQWGFQQKMGVDFAVLQLLQPPVNRHPLPISLAQSVTGTFRLRGYGVTLQEQSVGRGEFLGTFNRQSSSGNRLFQLRSPELSEEGYSGAAVFSDELEAVVAVQIEATNARIGAGRNTILAMPLYRIAQRWKGLSLLTSRPLLQQKSSKYASLDAQILQILYAYFRQHPGDPKISFNELIKISEAKQADVILCLYGLLEKKWLDYILTEGGESGLVWLTRLGIRVAKDASQN